MSDGNPGLRLEGLGKRLGGVAVLDRVSLTAAPGELVVILGPSGCGKSTLLRLVAGLEEADAGRILIGDQEVSRLSPRERDVAMVFQSYALYPHLDVAGNLGFGLKVRGAPRAEIAQRVAEVAELLDLGELLRRRPAQLSGGQRQRVAIGRAIARRPRLFLFDEPLSNLDARLRGQMRVELMRLHRRLGVTTLYVTHDQVEALTLGSQVVVLARGQVQQIGPPAEIDARPANLFVAGFVGSPPMNFLAGRVELAEGGPGLRCPEAELTLALPAWLADQAGAELVLGVRPEGLVLGADGFAARLELVERVGGEAWLHLARGRQVWVARAPAPPWPAPGETLRLALAPGAAHYFRAGQRLEPPGDGA